MSLGWSGLIFFLIFSLIHASKRSADPSRSIMTKQPIVINLNQVHQTTSSEYSKLLHLTLPEYRGYASSKAGQEHYPLLSYLSKLLSKSHYSFIDIGTRFGTSALVLASHGHHVITYDLPKSNELLLAISSIKLTKEKWLSELSRLNSSISIMNVDILSLNDEEFELIRHAPLILLDTHHRPYSTPFEREFLTRLASSHFNGLLLLDDIHENEEMNKWWNEIVCSQYTSYRVYDLTCVGHLTGTGLLDFSNRVVIEGDEKEKVMVNHKKCTTGPSGKQ